MKVKLPKSGIYVVAVSGGVDSMALLHMLNAKRQAGDRALIIVAAHLDHGIREDSVEDRKLVQEIANIYGIPFVYDEATLGHKASEAEARRARYDFLNKVKKNSLAEAIITAHHSDDMLETAVLNLSRGSGRKGLTSLNSNKSIIRPFLHVSKQQLIDYAKLNGLKWREDTTNSDTKYRRNHIRRNVLSKLDGNSKEELKRLIHKTRVTNDEIDGILSDLLHSNSDEGLLNRHWLVGLPHKIGLEIIATWLRENGYRDFDRKTLERLLVAAKVARIGSRIEIIKNAKMLVNNNTLKLVR